jgi:multidrug efflux pump subunit AcrB
MSRFAIRYPYLIIVFCLVIGVVGTSSLVRMPVDLFPPINIPVVVVATFYSGLPPEDIENDITGTYERFFTLASGIDHIQSRSLPGVSLIKVFFHPGTDADSDVTAITNLAMANLRRLPPGTLPPVVLKFDASSLPVCLITVRGRGLNQATLHDLAQYNVRNQVASTPGSSVPQPFGGKVRQIQVYLDPLKLQAYQLSAMDVVEKINNANLILPAGDVKIGPFDYNLYTNSQLSSVDKINQVPLKIVDDHPVLVADVGRAADDAAIQTNIVRVNSQRSVYIPVLKSGADANTIAVVDGIKSAVRNLRDIPSSLQTNVVFDQSVFVKTAIQNLIHEGLIGLVLTGLMILIFLGSARATLAVFLSIPLSALAAFIALYSGGSSINAMILGGLALAFSRLIDNSVIVLENIFRHMELGEPPEVAAENGGKEVSSAVLTATLVTAIVFFPVTFLSGVSQFLFTALASSVVLSLFASYFVAMTVVPLFCAKLIKAHRAHEASADGPQEPPKGLWAKFNWWFNSRFHAFLDRFDRVQGFALARPAATVIGILGLFCLSFALLPALGLAYFPRTDPGQFIINLKAATGTRIEITEQEVAKTEDLIRKIVSPHDLRLIVSNVGVTPDLSSIYTTNSSTHTAYVQVSLNDGHTVGSYAYIDRVRAAMQKELPELATYFQTGGLVDAIINQGLPAPIDIQVSGNNLKEDAKIAASLRNQVSRLPGVADAYVPEDVDAPSFKLQINRYYAQEMGLSEHEVVNNIVASLTSDGVISPSYWVDPKSGDLYLLTVQFPDNTVRSLEDLKNIPIRSSTQKNTTVLGNVASVKLIESPTEVDHYKIFRVVDVYVSTKGEELSRVASAVQHIVDQVKKEAPSDVRIDIHGIVDPMWSALESFGFGLILSLVLVYLVLVAQFRSFVDPFLILLAVPPGVAGVLLILTTTGTTLNIMSLMGVVMMVGIVVSNSILIVEFTHRLVEEGKTLREAVQFAVRVRLRPILMTSLATVIGLIPMALALEAGSESYAPLARAIIGGLLASVALTVFIVPSAVLLVYRNRKGSGGSQGRQPELTRTH